MSETKRDLMQCAIEYRKQLESEMSKVNEFIEMAEHLTNRPDDKAFGLRLASENDAPLELH